MTKKNFENGRSMVEMLGVLAVMGVLSVGGVAMYTNAMNKYRANELLNESSKRAVVIAAQILSGKSISSDMINQFDNNGTTFTGVEAVGTNQFKLTLSGVDDDVCTQLRATVGSNTIIQEVGDKCAYLTFNNDLSKGTSSSNENTAATDYTYENCPNQFYKCEASNTCVASASDCQCPENFDTHYGCRTCENGIISYPKTQGVLIEMIDEGDCASLGSNLRNPACSSKPDNFSNWGVCDGAGNCIECPAGSTSLAAMPLVPDAEHEECIAEETCTYAALTCEQSSTPGCFLATYHSVKKISIDEL